MKKIMFLCLIMPTFMVYGQRYKVPMNLPNYDKQKLHFGFLIGLNILDFKIMQNTQQEEQLFVIKSQDQKGFNLGIVSNYHLGRRFDLRAISTLSLAERRIQYVFRQQEDVLEDYQFVEVNKKIESTFIELPILIKYKSDRYNNGRAYLITGLKYALDLASQKNIDDENQQIAKVQRIVRELDFSLLKPLQNRGNIIRAKKIMHLQVLSFDSLLLCRMNGCLTEIFS